MAQGRVRSEKVREDTRDECEKSNTNSEEVAMRYKCLYTSYECVGEILRMRI